MSLFIDVIEPLSNQLKAKLLQVIENERKDQERSIRKVCETCMKYLDYGELRYDKMEDGIAEIEKTGNPDNPLFTLLLAVFNESLDEDQQAIEFFRKLSLTSVAVPFRQILEDFITVGNFATLGHTEDLEQAAGIIIERYSDENSITDILSNMYLKVEDEKNVPLFLSLVEKAQTLYPENIQVETLHAFFAVKMKEYEKALSSYHSIMQLIEKDPSNRFFDYNMALTWDNVAGCYLKMGDAAKTIESCDTALDYQKKTDDSQLANSILYKKAEACLLNNDKEGAKIILEPLLQENSDDETALELMSKAG